LLRILCWRRHWSVFLIILNDVGEHYKTMIIDSFSPKFNDMDVDDMWFQQDGVTCHTANATINNLHEQFEGMVITRRGDVNWPPRSCDLTSLDFFLWGS
jgi:hypothetical protein